MPQFEHTVERKYRGLGKDLVKANSVQEAFEQSGLNWKVREVPLAPLPSTDGRFKPREGARINGWKALIRPDKEAPDGFWPLDVTSDQYEVTQNEEIFETFAEIAKVGDMKIETAGEVDHGARVWVVGRLDGEFHFKNVSDKARIDGAGHEPPEGKKRDDRTFLKVMMGTGHRRGIALSFSAIAEREICWNGAVISSNVTAFRMIHKKKFTEQEVQAVISFIEGSRDAFKVYHGNMDTLRNIPFDEITTRAYALELMHPEELEPAVKEIEKKHPKLASKTLSEMQKLEKGQRLLDLLHGKQDIRNMCLYDSCEVGLGRGRKPLKVRQVVQFYESQPGAAMMPESAYKAYNAVTYFLNHHQGRTADTGFENTYFGKGVNLEHNALSLALDYGMRLSRVGKKEKEEAALVGA